MTRKAGPGRPPKPTALHKLHGTERARTRQARANEPMPEGDLDAPPNWLNDTQREGWEYAIRHSPRGMLKLLDRGLLALWVEAEDRHRLATITQNELNAKGKDLPFLVKGPDGLVASPYIDIIDRASKIMFRCADSLGFSPVARPRIKLVSEREQEADAHENPWALLSVIEGGKKP